MSDPSNTPALRPLPHGGYLSGIVRVPGDKSISHRALLFGAISEGTTTIDTIDRQEAEIQIRCYPLNKIKQTLLVGLIHMIC